MYAWTRNKICGVWEDAMIWIKNKLDVDIDLNYDYIREDTKLYHSYKSI